MNVSAILLAAGRSTRMGRNKLLLPWEGSTVIRTVGERLLEAPIEEVVVVLGHEADRVREALTGLDVRFVVNSGFEHGMGTSLATGVGAAALSAEAFLIALGDMPRTSPALIETVVQRAALDRIVVPRIGEREGNPVLFGNTYREELMVLRGDHGARAVIGAHRDRVDHVDWPFAIDFEDIDIPDDFL